MISRGPSKFNCSVIVSCDRQELSDQVYYTIVSVEGEKDLLCHSDTVKN